MGDCRTWGEEIQLGDQDVFPGRLGVPQWIPSVPGGGHGRRVEGQVVGMAVQDTSMQIHRHKRDMLAKARFAEMTKILLFLPPIALYAILVWLAVLFGMPWIAGAVVCIAVLHAQYELRRRG